MSELMPSSSVPLESANATAVETVDPLAAEKEQRDKRLRRFNWLTIYLPLIVTVALALVLFGGLTVLALSSDGSLERGQASGVADTFLVTLFLLPLSLICAVFPAGGVYFLYWRRQKGSLARERVTTLIRKIDGGVHTADTKLNEQKPRIEEKTTAARQQVDRTIEIIYSYVVKLAEWIDSKLR